MWKEMNKVLFQKSKELIFGKPGGLRAPYASGLVNGKRMRNMCTTACLY